MLITYAMLRRAGACGDGLEWFDEQFPYDLDTNKDEDLRVVAFEGGSQYVYWVISNLLNEGGDCAVAIDRLAYALIRWIVYANTVLSDSESQRIYEMYSYLQLQVIAAHIDQEEIKG